MNMYKCKTRLEYARLVFFRPGLTLEEMCFIIHYYFWINEAWFVQAGLAEKGALGEFQFITPHLLYEDPEEKMSAEEICQKWQEPGINK